MTEAQMSIAAANSASFVDTMKERAMQILAVGVAVGTLALGAVSERADAAVPEKGMAEATCAVFDAAGLAEVHTAEAAVDVAKDARKEAKAGSSEELRARATVKEAKADEKEARANYLAPFKAKVEDARNKRKEAERGSSEYLRAKADEKEARQNLRDAKKADRECGVEVESKECKKTFVIVETDNANSRIMAEGVPEIQAAETPEQARLALVAWSEKALADPDVAKSAYKVILGKDVSREELIDASGKCASKLNAELAGEVAVKLAIAKVTPDQAPATGTNTGVDTTGQVVVAEQAGISGNRKAIKVVLTNPDGTTTTFWVMYRCGNMVFEGTPPSEFPKGPTDEKHPQPLPGPDTQPGSGGNQGRADEPSCDSDNDGYCDGQAPVNGGGNTGGNQGNSGGVGPTPTTGPPRVEAPATPATTLPGPEAPSGGGKPTVPVN